MIGSQYTEDLNPTSDDLLLSIDINGLGNATKTVSISTLARIINSANRPVGSLFFHTTADDPATILGFGTWQRHAKGSAIVGVADTGTFATPNVVVGAETVTLTTNEMPSHAHSVYDPGHSHGFSRDLVVTSGSGTQRTYLGGGSGQQLAWSAVGSTNGSGTGIGIYANGGGAAHNNVQPSIPVYIWKRTS